MLDSIAMAIFRAVPLETMSMLSAFFKTWDMFEVQQRKAGRIAPTATSALQSVNPAISVVSHRRSKDGLESPHLTTIQ